MVVHATANMILFLESRLHSGYRIVEGRLHRHDAVRVHM
jgi:hypothetical protein